MDFVVVESLSLVVLVVVVVEVVVVVVAAAAVGYVPRAEGQLRMSICESLFGSA
jgi:hypothetical protein